MKIFNTRVKYTTPTQDFNNQNIEENVFLYKTSSTYSHRSTLKKLDAPPECSNCKLKIWKSEGMTIAYVEAHDLLSIIS